jgi:hypothetical protein
MASYFVGIDIQIRRNCCYAVIDTSGTVCKPGPKDMLDAWIATATVREFVEGRGTEVGGGDGLRDDNPAKAIARASHKRGSSVAGINYFRFLW